MAVDTTHLRGVAERLKRQTTNRDVLDLCDGVGALVMLLDAERLKSFPPTYCHACASKRAGRTAAQQRWREKRKSNG